MDADGFAARVAFGAVEQLVCTAVHQSGTLLQYIIQHRRERVLRVIASLYPRDLSVGVLARRYGGLRKQLERCARESWLT